MTTQSRNTMAPMQNNGYSIVSGKTLPKHIKLTLILFRSKTSSFSVCIPSSPSTLLISFPVQVNRKKYKFRRKTKPITWFRIKATVMGCRASDAYLVRIKLLNRLVLRAVEPPYWLYRCICYQGVKQLLGFI